MRNVIAWKHRGLEQLWFEIQIQSFWLKVSFTLSCIKPTFPNKTFIQNLLCHPQIPSLGFYNTACLHISRSCHKTFQGVSCCHYLRIFLRFGRRTSHLLTEELREEPAFTFPSGGVHFTSLGMNWNHLMNGEDYYGVKVGNTTAERNFSSQRNPCHLPQGSNRPDSPAWHPRPPAPRGNNYGHNF